jgi:hypothetical protein
LPQVTPSSRTYAEVATKSPLTNLAQTTYAQPSTNR